MAAKIVRYTVTGSGAFPMDMLRYDSTWPRDSDDAHTMGAGDNYTLRERRTVKLAGLRVTAARWASFGWHVDMEVK